MWHIAFACDSGIGGERSGEICLSCARVSNLFAALTQLLFMTHTGPDACGMCTRRQARLI